MHFTFKQITQPDIALLRTWFKEPHVAAWWPVPAFDESMDNFIENKRLKNTIGYIALLDEVPIGYIQYYELDRAHKTGAWLPDLPATTLGTDLFIGDSAYIGKGYGAPLITSFLAFLTKLRPDITTMIVDPDPLNHAAIRCYEKAGFIPVGEYEVPWGQALLMRWDVN